MRPYRTVLEQKIRERRQTFEEFAEHVEAFARAHDEPGTLSVRHLQRLVAGRRSDGRPLGPVQPATARLLEQILGLSMEELLAPPSTPQENDGSEMELRHRLYVSRQVNGAMLNTLRDHLNGIRHLDRELGAAIVHEEVNAKIDQVTGLLAYSVALGTRAPLAALLSELCCLAGWQSLDLGRTEESWQHYNNANKAAAESGIPSFKALAAAGRAFVMADIGETSTAVDLAAASRKEADRRCSSLLRAWLAAAHGEALAANGQRNESLRAFDKADDLLPTDETDPEDPYVALDTTHLARWRGFALAKSGEPEAIDVLTGALQHLDPTFVRAETALRVDLTLALATHGESAESRVQMTSAQQLATQVGSIRQLRRLQSLAANFDSQP